MRFTVSTCFLLAILCLACNPQRRISGFYDYQTECLGSELDGSITVKAWGSGKNRKDAIEQAKKNAVRDVLFKGIKIGKDGCSVVPVFSNPNLNSIQEDYLFKFFQDGGEYIRFVSSDEESFIRRAVRDKRKEKNNMTQAGIVRINVAGLRNKLREDKILK